MDAAWVLSRTDSLFDPRVAAGLGLDLGLIQRHVERISARLSTGELPHR
jgi:hypothetical protein